MTEKDSQLKLSNVFHGKVRFSECDPLGIVWHGHYILYFEDGREAFGKEHGISYLDVQKNGFATSITKTQTEHLHPLKYGENYTVVTTYIPSQAAKMIFEYQIFNEEGKIVCKGKTEQVFIDNDGNLQLYNPPFYQQWKNKMKL